MHRLLCEKAREQYAEAIVSLDRALLIGGAPLPANRFDLRGREQGRPTEPWRDLLAGCRATSGIYRRAVAPSRRTRCRGWRRSHRAALSLALGQPLMARLDEQRRALAMNIRFNRAAENELTPAQARLFVRSLQTSWQVPPIAWGPRDRMSSSMTRGGFCMRQDLPRDRRRRLAGIARLLSTRG